MNFIALELALIAAGYVAVSVIAQRKISNVKRIREIRTQLNAKMANMRKLDRNTSREIMDAEQKEMAALTSEMMKHQLKASMIVLPVFVILVYFALPYIFGNQNFSITILSFKLTYSSFFVAVAFVLGMLSQAVIAVYDKMAAKKAASAGPAEDALSNNA